MTKSDVSKDFRSVLLRRVLFQIHLWCGIGLGLYIFFISVTGSVLVYRNELYVAAAPEQIASQSSESSVQDNDEATGVWLAYSHFGRINGIGIPCTGPGLCDQTIKAIWAVFGLAPAAMFVTGAIMWWDRVLRPWRRATV